MERRKEVRYPLHVPVSFSWDDESGAHHQRKGSTRDISAKGAFVFAPACPPAGADINLEIFLPPISDTAPRVHVRADAQVLRVEEGVREEARNGFAVRNQKTFFLREGQIIEDEPADGQAPEL
ncbi:MAG TPA: PilZ domain-containing protein [Candidatus Acidoferrales bacterium]|nr:PilZ domain-containing protein [Candidatus Acidoferrales bacterium]